MLGWQHPRLGGIGLAFLRCCMTKISYQKRRGADSEGPALRRFLGVPDDCPTCQEHGTIGFRDGVYVCNRCSRTWAINWQYGFAREIARNGQADFFCPDRNDDVHGVLSKSQLARAGATFDRKWGDLSKSQCSKAKSVFGRKWGAGPKMKGGVGAEVRKWCERHGIYDTDPESPLWQHPVYSGIIEQAGIELWNTILQFLHDGRDPETISCKLIACKAYDLWKNENRVGTKQEWKAIKELERWPARCAKARGDESKDHLEQGRLRGAERRAARWAEARGKKAGGRLEARLPEGETVGVDHAGSIDYTDIENVGPRARRVTYHEPERIAPPINWTAIDARLDGGKFGGLPKLADAANRYGLSADDVAKRIGKTASYVLRTPQWFGGLRVESRWYFPEDIGGPLADPRVQVDWRHPHASLELELLALLPIEPSEATTADLARDLGVPSWLAILTSLYRLQREYAIRLRKRGLFILASLRENGAAEAKARAEIYMRAIYEDGAK
jgi:hypothetical protein